MALISRNLRVYLVEISLPTEKQFCRLPDRFGPHSRFPGLVLALNCMGRELDVVTSQISRFGPENRALFRGMICTGSELRFSGFGLGYWMVG